MPRNKPRKINYSDPRRKYKPWMDEAIVKVAEEGGFVAAMCMKIGIRSKDTFYRWTREYPTFGEAYEEAQIASQAFYEALCLQGAMGQIDKFNFSAVAIILNNKFRQEYTRSTQGPNTQINIGHQVNEIDAMSNEEREAKIDKLNKKLGYVRVGSIEHSESFVDDYESETTELIEHDP